MFRSQMTRRLPKWLSRFRAFGPGAEQSADRARRHKSRSLRMESLEQRALLSVTTIANTWKDLAFVGSGTVKGAFAGEGVIGSYSGSMTDIHGTLHYTSNTEGTLVEGTNGGTGNGRWSARTPFGPFSGLWNVQGHAENLTDANGVLAGNGVADVFTLTNAPLDPEIEGGSYGMTGTFDTKTFKIHADFPTGQFNGTIQDTATGAFDVVVTPSWSETGVDVDVDVPGPVQKAKSHTTAVTNVELYWAKGPAFSKKMGKALDKIPVYWNEASGDYTVTDVPTAPAGATHLLFATKVGGKTKVAALALPTVTVDTATVDEGQGDVVPAVQQAEGNSADFKVTLSQAYSQDVTLWYTTVKGKADKVAGTMGATPGVDYGDSAKKNKEFTGSLTIHAGDTEGHILVPIVGDTTFETDETFSLKITKVQNAGIDKANSQVLGTITNDDAQPVISIADASVTEPTKGTAKMQFVVTLANPSYQKVQVKYATQDDTATAGQDYVKKQGTLTFKPGQTTATFTVTVKADKVVDVDDETFLVNLIPFGTSDATIGDGEAVGTILDNAPPAIAGTASRDAALGQLAGSGQLAACFDQLGRMKSEKDAAAADSVPAAL